MSVPCLSECYIRGVRVLSYLLAIQGFALGLGLGLLQDDYARGIGAKTSTFNLVLGFVLGLQAPGLFALRRLSGLREFAFVLIFLSG